MGELPWPLAGSSLPKEGHGHPSLSTSLAHPGASEVQNILEPPMFSCRFGKSVQVPALASHIPLGLDRRLCLARAGAAPQGRGPPLPVPQTAPILSLPGVGAAALSCVPVGAELGGVLGPLVLLGVLPAQRGGSVSTLPNHWGPGRDPAGLSLALQMDGEREAWERERRGRGRSPAWNLIVRCLICQRGQLAAPPGGLINAGEAPARQSCLNWYQDVPGLHLPGPCLPPFLPSCHLLLHPVGLHPSRAHLHPPSGRCGSCSPGRWARPVTPTPPLGGQHPRVPAHADRALCPPAHPHKAPQGWEPSPMLPHAQEVAPGGAGDLGSRGPRGQKDTRGLLVPRTSLRLSRKACWDLRVSVAQSGKFREVWQPV